MAPKDVSDVLEKTRTSFFSRLKSVFSSESGLESGDLEDLEEILYTSDLGPQTVQRLMEAMEEHLSGADKRNLDKVVESLKFEMNNIFRKTLKKIFSSLNILIFKLHLQLGYYKRCLINIRVIIK